MGMPNICANCAQSDTDCLFQSTHGIAVAKAPISLGSPRNNVFSQLSNGTPPHVGRQLEHLLGERLDVSFVYRCELDEPLLVLPELVCGETRTPTDQAVTSRNL